MGHGANIGAATLADQHATRSVMVTSRITFEPNTRGLCAHDNTCHKIKDSLGTPTTLWVPDDRDVTPTLGCTTLTQPSIQGLHNITHNYHAQRI
jgi:hypothetical protein